MVLMPVMGTDPTPWSSPSYGRRSLKSPLKGEMLRFAQLSKSTSKPLESKSTKCGIGSCSDWCAAANAKFGAVGNIYRWIFSGTLPVKVAKLKAVINAKR